MKWIKRCFHFLGSIYFAIILIATVATAVAVGTILESQADSHLFAAQWTYHHPLFAFLLWLFFINILFSALRRWPFKPHHIPFLITHFGLLMMIGGTLVKNRKGLQGNLSLWEGSGSQMLHLPQTYALLIEKKNAPADITRHVYPVSLEGRQIYQTDPFSSLKIKVLGSVPHVNERWETWIKGDRLQIIGLPSLPVQEWKEREETSTGAILPLEGQNWHVEALRTDHLQEAIRHIYLDNLTLRLSSKQDAAQSFEGPLKDILAHPLSWNGGTLSAQLLLAYSPISGFGQPMLEIEWQEESKTRKERFQIALNGSQSLYAVSAEGEWPKSSIFQIDLQRPTPILLALEDSHRDTFLFAFDRHGRVQGKAFRQGHLETLYTYDQGFGGYTVHALFPHPAFPSGRKDKEEADRHFLVQQLRQAFDSPARLAPPLEVFQKACQAAQVPFAETLVEFLVEWNNYPGLLYSATPASPVLAKAIQHINWSAIPPKDLEGCRWICQLFQQLDYAYQEGKGLFPFLQEHRWPFLADLSDQREKEPEKDLLALLAQQVLSIAAYLPPLDEESDFSLSAQAHLLSAYLKGYDITYASLNPLPKQGLETFDRLEAYWKSEKFFQADKPSSLFLSVETPLSICYRTEPSQKLEDNRPCLFLEVQEGEKKQFLSLAYDPSGFGLKWPMLNGDYLIRFQPQIIELPYRLRLRQARQINYPHSQQPFSYEGDVLITGQDGQSVEKTLSMNHVHETWDGYRFYLAGMSAPSDQSAKRVQLAVNHDPAKYILTYPGALIVTIGTFLLFWLRPYRKKRDP
ncbi:hypothetical protein [Candidatus Protochlamydia phocaeensis]|uniref:hypothetical protein n=1 Tax=Candidatus Protochlamydia phocaeensis TaxID=1414722 RepID=UPI0008394D87|nr:hypothetical protein [Candidatus Protochlamydia phocaeensis]